MKGIVLAGGNGTRLTPVTKSISKHLLPIYDKPMIYYPISTLISIGIDEILLVCMSYQQYLYEELLGDGSQWGIKISYASQDHANGIAQALCIGEEFIGGESVCLILGDNILYGQGLPDFLRQFCSLTEGAVTFGYPVRDPERYGVVHFGDHGEVIDIIEKPTHPKSNYAVIGLYFYDNQATKIAKSLKPSKRGEYEITDVNQAYLQAGKLKVERMGRGIAWLDTGTHGSILAASRFVEVLEERQGLKIGCPEEVAWRAGFIDTDQLHRLAESQRSSGYGDYLLKITELYA